jgi:uncharacterized membrane protein
MQPPFHEDPPPSSQMSATERTKASLEQRMLEAQLEIVRSARQQRESRQSRKIWLVATFGFSSFVAYVFDHKGASPVVSFVACVVTFVLLATWWAFRKTY